VRTPQRGRPTGSSTRAATPFANGQHPPPAGDGGDGVGRSVGERLAAARARQGIDLARVERETKIRAAYLAALEADDPDALPPPVYALGFLRTYARYLGLDPEELALQWRREHPPAPPALETPQPLPAIGRPLVIPPQAVVAILLLGAVLAFVAYLGFQLVRFARPPVVAVTEPPVAVSQVASDTGTTILAGTATPGSVVEVRAAGRDQPYRVPVAADGRWSVQVNLQRGRNSFSIVATDPETGKVSDEARIVITVPYPVIEAPGLALDSPADGAVFTNGAIPIRGQATNAVSVTISAAPAPGSTASPAPSPMASPPASPSGPGASPAPLTQTLRPDPSGAFDAALQLGAGTWTITVTAAGADGKTTTLTRTVRVAYQGLTVVISVRGGRAWLKIWVDDVVSPLTGTAGRILGDGASLTVTGKASVEVRTGSSGVTFFTVNGVPLGTLGRPGVPETWRFTPGAPPQLTNRQ
jgi:cytoskeletal protein RodZ